MRHLLLLLVVLLAVAACGQDPAVDAPDAGAADADGDGEPAGTDVHPSDQPADARAIFSAPADGDVVPTPVRLDMSATGVEIVPAGDPALGEAHLHVAVDAGCVGDGEVVPGPGEDAEAAGYYHFGDGSTSAELPLQPGTYELCLQLADGAHRAFGGTETIAITVE